MKIKNLPIRLIYLFLVLFILSFLLVILHIRLQNTPKEASNNKTSNKQEKQEIYISDIPSLKTLYSNDDIIAKIKIPSLELDEIIVKGTDNSYYLKHDIQNKETKIGTAFMDYRTPDIAYAKQINIYGHNSTDSSLPFAKLEKYQEEEFFKNNPNLILETEERAYKYKIFSVTNVPKDSEEHMIISYENEEFLNHVKTMRSNALLDTNEEIKKDDSILVIQTCLFKPERFLLILAKRL